MWEWILNNLTAVVQKMHLSKSISGVEKDDIVSMVIMRLCEDRKLAQQIYDEKKTGLLYRMAKCEIYEQKSKMFFKNKMELSRYQRIIDICDKYNIEASPENAYKISALMEDGCANFTISGVMTLLSAESPIRYGYSSREYSYADEFVK